MERTRRLTRCTTCPKWIQSNSNARCVDCIQRTTTSISRDFVPSTVVGMGSHPRTLEPTSNQPRLLRRPQRSLVEPHQPELATETPLRPSNPALGAIPRVLNRERPTDAHQHDQSMWWDHEHDLPTARNLEASPPNAHLLDLPPSYDVAARIASGFTWPTGRTFPSQPTSAERDTIQPNRTNEEFEANGATASTSVPFLNCDQSEPRPQAENSTGGSGQASSSIPNTFRGPIPSPRPRNTDFERLRRENEDLNRRVDDLAALLEELRRPPPTAANLRAVPPTPTAPDRPNYSRRHEADELPIFDGKTSDGWLRFDAAFMYLVRSGLTDDEIVSAFNRTLKGEAYRIVEHLLVIRADPQLVMDELRSFYGDAKNVISRLTRAVLNTRAMKGSYDPELLELAIRVKGLVTNILHFDRLPDLESTYLIESVVRKLSDDHQQRWYTVYNAYPNATLEDLSNFLMNRAKEVSSRQRLQQPSTVTRTSTRPVNLHETVDWGEQLEPDLEDTVDIGAHITCPATRSVIRCYLCGEDHRLVDCVQFINYTVAEKYDFAHQRRLCTCCLASHEHGWRACPQKRKCTLSWCSNFHHPLLHRVLPPAGPATTHGEASATAGNVERPAASTPLNSHVATERLNSPPMPLPPPDSVHNLTHATPAKLLYGILPVLIKAANGEWIPIYAMIDSGSGATLMDAALQRKLGLRGTAAPMTLRWTDESTRVESDSRRIQVQLKNVQNHRVITLNDVRTITKLQLPTQTQDAARLQKAFPHLRSLPIPTYTAVQPQLLIGLTHVKLCFGGQTREGHEDEPLATKTPLGWAIFGPKSSPTPSPSFIGVHRSEVDDSHLERAVDNLFKLENVHVDASDLLSKNEKRVKQLVDRTLRQIGQRYEIGLFWRTDDITLPDSYPMALRRLEGFERQLKKRPELLEFVRTRLQQLIEAGHARKATEQDLVTVWPRTWYLPLFVVMHPSKNKPRLVCDAAAEVDGVSLNTVQLSGDNLTVPIIGPLFRLRQYAIGVSGDARDMFPQIRITEADQQCQRFLWRDMNQDQQPEVYIHQGMTFGSTSSPFSAQVAKNTHAAKFAESEPEAVDALINGTYVDDYTDSRKNVAEAARVTNAAIAIMKKMSLELVNFQSNSAELLKLLPISHVRPEFVDLDPQRDFPDTCVKILGLEWSPREDELRYKLNEKQLHLAAISGEGVSKRQLLSTIMRMYDPLGLLSHFAVQGRRLLQDAWRIKATWDEHLPVDLAKRLAEWVRLLRQVVVDLRFPRCYVPFDADEATIELHVFTDASEYAMSATAYFRMTWGSTVTVTQVMAKAKTMPLRGLSIPQAELEGAVMGTRLAATVRSLHTFHIKSTTYWTDSKCVLAQLKTNNKLKPYFQARVNEILATSDLTEWNYVPSLLNPADYGTKWHPDSLDRDNIWFNGPAFLRLPNSEWPGFTASSMPEDTFLLATILEEDIPVTTHVLADDIRLSRAHTWLRLVKIVAYRVRFVDRLMRRPTPDLFLDPVALKRAENHIFAAIQATTFPEERDQLRRNGAVDRSSPLFKLTPFIDEHGVIRVQSRLQNAPITYSARNPAILVNNHPWVELMVAQHHELHDHVGDEQVIASLRTRAWIINVRSAVRRIRERCQQCRERRATVVNPRMAPLPDFRVNPTEYPWEHTGVDMFGPIELHRGRSTIVKRYVLIFTCMVTRAVHLELVYDKTKDEVMAAMEVFIGTRGRPKHMYSDQGTNFTGALGLMSRDLAALRQEIGEQASLRYQIYWHFNLAYTPHWGAPWERLIKDVKAGLNMSRLLEHRPSEQIFQRAIKSVEARMNSRPLTATPVSPDNAEPLTPNHFLIGHANNLGSTHSTSQRDGISTFGYRRVQYLAQMMWGRWLREYLPVLTKRGRWFREEPEIQVGDVVLVINGNRNRDNWIKSRVTRTYPGKDGRTRAVDVATFQGNVTMRVSVSNVARLNVSSSTTRAQSTGGSVSSTDLHTQQF